MRSCEVGQICWIREPARDRGKVTEPAPFPKPAYLALHFVKSCLLVSSAAVKHSVRRAKSPARRLSTVLDRKSRQRSMGKTVGRGGKSTILSYAARAAKDKKRRPRRVDWTVSKSRKKFRMDRRAP
ncbi:hypothetical protein L914_16005, partial [Phytophthora nicotianae]